MDEILSTTSVDSSEEDLFSKYGAQAATAGDHMGLAPTLIHGAVASVADFGATVWNSLPLTEDVNTEDLLSRIDQDALQVYNEHPDAVKAASFIGGSFLPVGLAMKGMTALRAGSTSANWFTKAGATARLAEVEKSFSMAEGITTASQRAIYGAAAANALVDSVAAEAAVVLTMNAHPYMEDYNKDFKSNFAFWSLVGGGVGGAFGMIGERALLRNLSHGIESKAIAEVSEGVRGTAPSISYRDQLKITQIDIETNEAKLARSRDPSITDYNLNPYTENLLEFDITRRKAALADSMESLAKGDLKEAEKSLRDNITQLLVKDERFSGVDSAAFYSSSASPSDIFAQIKQVPQFIKKTLVGGETSLEYQKAIFIRGANKGAGGFTSLEDAPNFSNIADAVAGNENVLKNAVKKVTPTFANQDAFFELSAMATKEADLTFAATMKRFSEMDSLKEFNRSNIARTDLPSLMAAMVKANTLDLSQGLKVNISGMSAVELAEATKEAFVESVKELVKRGAAIDTIALKTGSTTEMVEKVLAKESVIASDIPRYKTVEDIEKAIDQTNRSIVLSLNPRKVDNATQAANLNVRTLDALNNSLTDMYMMSSRSSVVRNIADALSTEDFKIKMDALLKGIGEVTPSGMKNLYVTSTNFATEKFGIAGILATQMGRDHTLLHNEASKKFLQPILDLGTTLSKNDAALIEHNMALNFNASLKDYRVFDKETGRFMIKQIDAVSKKEVLVPAMKNGKVFEVVDEDVKKMFGFYQDLGKEIYELINVPNKVLGKAPVRDLGFWVPAFNPRDKQIAYVHNVKTDAVSILHAKTVEELNVEVAKFRARLLAEGDTDTKVFTKGVEQKMYNKIAGRVDPAFMTVADVSKFHEGASAGALVKTNIEPLTELINGLDHSLGNGISQLIELKMQPVMDSLKQVSDISQRGYEKGTLGVVGQGIKKPADPGLAMKNTILGKPNLDQFESWKDWQQGGQVYTDIALKKVSDIFSTVFGTPNSGRTAESWKEVNAQLEKNGLTPFSHADDFNRYLREGTTTQENLTPKVIALSNGIAATMLLKFLELAQPLVNMISLPILTSGAIRRKLENSFMDGVLNQDAKFHLIESMYDGIRLMNHPTLGARFSAIGHKEQLFEPIISEVSGTLREIHSVGGGKIAQAEKLLESNFLKITSVGANYSEMLVRKSTFFTGVALARKAYPGISDLGAVTFARNFMDEAIGNYTASQRPILFQGTFGVAMGLFQTYMLTLGQHIYRGIENKDWAGLGKMMLTQGTIFGASSLPGFAPISEAIGTHLSDNHYDLESGTFRALPNEEAKILLYGLPSSMGPGVTTRGDIRLRVPNPLDMASSIPNINIAKQAYSTAENLIKAAFTADKNTGRAMLEALSLQSVSRPIARMSELAGGNAITGAGEKVAGASEIYTPVGVISRILSTRPIEEVKSRQALHLNSVYGGVDSENRRNIMEKLKTHIRDGDLSPEKVQELQFEYLRTGSVSGWRSAVRGALLETTRTGARNVKENLRDDAPWQQLVNDLEK